MRSWRLLAETLVSPVSAFRALVETHRSMVALLVVIAAQLTVPAALVGRIDVRRDLVRDLQSSGKLADTTDRELGDKVEQVAKLQEAKYAALGLFGPPFRALLLTIGLWLWSRLLRTTPAFGALWSLCAHAQLPLAIRSLAQAFVLSRQDYIYPEQIDTVLPSGLSSFVAVHLPAGLESLLSGLDFFRLWTAVLLGVALYTSSKMGAWKASIGIGLAYAFFVVVVFVGLPQLVGA